MPHRSKDRTEENFRGFGLTAERDGFEWRQTPSTLPARRCTSPTCGAKGVRSLIAYCLNDACRHQAVIDVSSYPGDTLIPWFRTKVKCAKCGARHSKIDVRPNWKEAPGSVTDWRGRPSQKKWTPLGSQRGPLHWDNVKNGAWIAPPFPRIPPGVLA